jgi:signal transduction histidine kinase
LSAGFPQRYALGVGASSPSSTEHRLRALLDAAIALNSELSLDGLLQRCVELAADLTEARYAALGVIDRTGSQLDRFITHGVDAETHATIGDLPRGRGILGALIRDAATLRLHDLAADPRAVGFPPGHPPMRTFLGVPIMLRGVAYGNLYLTEKADGEDFTEEDEEVATILAGQAAVAIEDARLYEASMRWSRQLETLNEIGTALATETERDRLLDLIARRVRELVDARVVAVLLPSGSERLVVAAVAGDATGGLLGRHLDRAGSKSGRVLDLARPERSDSLLDDPEVDQAMVRSLGARTGLWVPLVARGRPIGVLEVHDRYGADARFADDDVRMAEQFAVRAAIAVDLSDRVARDSLQRIVTAQESERRRMARELHDETGQALSSILLGLRRLDDSLGEEGRAQVAELRDLVVETLHDVRRLAVELRPKALDDFGLVAALERLTDSFGEQTGIAIDFESALPDGRLSPDVETALYRIVQEALTNVVKHAKARHVSVLLTRRDGAVAALIEDDGTGFDPSAVGDSSFGLVGMRERIELLDGRLRVESRPGAGATLVVEVPLR